MQRNVFKLPLIALTFIALLFTSCKKDADTFEEQIQGSWEVTSFTINSQEAMGLFFSEFTFSFRAYSGTEGAVVLTQVDSDGEVDAVTGSYVIEGEMVKIDADDEVIDFSTEMNDNKMTMSGTDVDGLDYVVKLEK